MEGTSFEAREDARTEALYGELQIIGRRLERVQHFAGTLATEAADDDWLTVREHCASAIATVATAAVLVPSGNLEPQPLIQELVVRDLRLDRPSRRVWFAGEEIVVANLEYELLQTLAEEPFRVFTKEELLAQVWHYRTPVRTRTVDSHASRVRRKLADAGASTNEWLVNTWGVGYALVR